MFLPFALPKWMPLWFLAVWSVGLWAGAQCSLRADEQSTPRRYQNLVAEMLEEVSRERGALPLLAFAAAGLWERAHRLLKHQG